MYMYKADILGNDIRGVGWRGAPKCDTLDVLIVVSQYGWLVRIECSCIWGWLYNCNFSMANLKITPFDLCRLKKKIKIKKLTLTLDYVGCVRASD
jgi:hypothetical protein